MPRKQRFKPSRKPSPSPATDGAAAAPAGHEENDLDRRVTAERHSDIEHDGKVALQTQDANEHDGETAPQTRDAVEPGPTSPREPQVVPAETD